MELKEKTKICPLCSGSAHLVYEKMKGYIEGTSYDIFECAQCDATFVDPLKSDSKLYEYIYQKADKVPGYERYYRYADLVKKVKNPLDALCNAESVYWSVRKALEDSFSDKTNISILEIGSGLGYMTYSLNKAGYRTMGLDISEEAVKNATRHFGSYYRAGDLFKLASDGVEKYDCIIMLEIIEHVEDPKSFLAAALSLLKENGKLIMTTPNKTSAPHPVIWQSDFPPVHLWFMSEQTVLELARNLSKKCSFVDFTDFSRKFYAPNYFASVEDLQLGLPRFTKDGDIFPGHEVSKIKTLFFGNWGRYILSYIRRRLKPKIISSRGTTLCAIFSNKN